MPITIGNDLNAAAEQLEFSILRDEATRVGRLRSSTRPVAVLLEMAVREETPRGTLPLEEGQKRLVDTTYSLPAVFSGSSYTLAVGQRKTVQSSRMTSPYPLTRLVQEGHDPPSMPIVPIRKRALYWPGLPHPVASSPGGAYAGNRYGDRALAAALPAVALGIEQALTVVRP